MMKLVLLASLMIVAPEMAANPGLQQEPAGNWTGGFLMEGRWTAVLIRFAADAGQLEGRGDLVLPNYGGTGNAIDVPLQNVRHADGGVHFEIQSGSEMARFDGRIQGNTIQGSFSLGAERGEFGLTRWARIPLETLEEYYGAYRLAPDRVISIMRGWGYTRTLNYVDYGSGQVGTLWPSSDTEFFAGRGQAVSYPVSLTASFERDSRGRVTSMLWRAGNEPPREARRIDVREQAIRFQNRDVTLGGTLIVPAAARRAPVVIVTPGDYGTNRNQLRLWAHNFVSHGVAAFIFDARGSGESGGPVNSSSFSDLADDVLAAVDALQSVDVVNPRQIGLFGFSNSTYTVSLAASRSQDVAFLILQSLVGIEGWKQESFRAETQLRVDGFPETVVREGAEFMRLKYEVARTGQGWDRLQAVIAQARGERWLSYTSPPDNLPRLRQTYAAIMTYDPVPALATLRIPILALWGEKDTYLPVRESVANFRSAMRAAGNTDHVVEIYSNCSHSLLQTGTGSPSTGGTETSFCPGVWQLEADWLMKHVTPG
jgi:pimeloyl-ACP methyl ester carboxylesterase